MIIWALIIASQLHAGGPYMAFGSAEKCRTALAQIKVVGRCIPFAADISDGKEE